MGEPQMPPWRGRVNELLYGVNTSRPVPDEDVARVASLVVGQRVYIEPVSTYYDAIIAALTAREPIAPGGEDAAARDFLRRLGEELRARHPWPEPPYRPVRDAAASLPAMRHVGRIEKGWMSVQDAVGASFEPADRAFELVLRMSSGALVLLHAPASTPTVDVLTDATDPEAVRAELSRATKLAIT